MFNDTTTALRFMLPLLFSCVNRKNRIPHTCTKEASCNALLSFSNYLQPKHFLLLCSFEIFETRKSLGNSTSSLKLIPFGIKSAFMWRRMSNKFLMMQLSNGCSRYQITRRYRNSASRFIKNWLHCTSTTWSLHHPCTLPHSFFSIFVEKSLKKSHPVRNSLIFNWVCQTSN